jgi:hypothetical protein
MGRSRRMGKCETDDCKRRAVARMLDLPINVTTGRPSRDPSPKIGGAFPQCETDGGSFMDHFVTVDRLPPGYTIPRDMKDRISYDAATRRLTCHGYMSKTDFDRLSQLTGDWAFRRKLEELFQASAYNDRLVARGGLLSGLLRRFVAG